VPGKAAKKKSRKAAKAKKGSVTLAAVGRRANRDPQFFQAVLENPNAALTAARLVLSARDMNKLTALVEDARRRPMRDGGFILQVAPVTALKVMARRRVSSDEGWPSPFWPMKWASLRFNGPAQPAELELLPADVRLPGIH
jgi:hypothetical protein